MQEMSNMENSTAEQDTFTLTHFTQKTGGQWNKGKHRTEVKKDKQRGDTAPEPWMEDFKGQGRESNRRRWQERPLFGGHSTGMGQEWEWAKHKPETKHFQLFCWEFSIASFTVRGTEAGEREGETEEGRRETAEAISSDTALVFPVGPRSASTVSSLFCCVVVTCGLISGDSQPGRLICLSYIIGHFTYILSALLLSHIVEGQHLSIRAIDPRMLEIKTCHVQHRKKHVKHRIKLDKEFIINSVITAKQNPYFWISMHFYRERWTSKKRTDIATQNNHYKTDWNWLVAVGLVTKLLPWGHGHTVTHQDQLGSHWPRCASTTGYEAEGHWTLCIQTQHHCPLLQCD